MFAKLHFEETKMDIALRPCPFCGGTAELKESYYLESELPYSYVHCTNPSCTLHHNTAHFSGDSEAKNSEAAITAWNRRVENPVEQI
jgi:Restriction alleviation protein Lar